MKSKYKCILVDDLEGNLRALKAEVEEIGLLEVEAVYTDPRKFLDNVKEHESKIIFLDVNMPIDGITVGEKLFGKKIIYVSGHVHRASDAMLIDAVGFVEKPIEQARLKKFIEKAISEIRRSQTHLRFGKEVVAVSSIELITSQDIDNNSSSQGESKLIYLNGSPPMLVNSLKLDDCERDLDPDLFIRINRFDIVRKNCIKSYAHEQVKISYTNKKGHQAFTERPLNKEGKKRLDALFNVH